MSFFSFLRATNFSKILLDENSKPSLMKTSIIAAAVGVKGNGVCSHGVAYNSKYTLVGATQVSIDTFGVTSSSSLLISSKRLRLDSRGFPMIHMRMFLLLIMVDQIIEQLHVVS
jgi:hypothetical protein